MKNNLSTNYFKIIGRNIFLIVMLILFAKCSESPAEPEKRLELKKNVIHITVEEKTIVEIPEISLEDPPILNVYKNNNTFSFGRAERTQLPAAQIVEGGVVLNNAGEYTIVFIQ